MKHISIATSFLQGFDPVGDLEIFRRAGYTALSADFWQFSTHGRFLTRDDWQQTLEKYRERAQALGIVFPQSHGNTLSGMQWDDPAYAEEAERVWALNHRAIDASRTLGCEWMVMHPYNLPHEPLYSAKRALEVNLKYLAPFIEHAKQAGVGIALENMVDFGGNRRRYCGGDAFELLELVETINDPDVGICLDTGHAHLSGIDNAEFIRLAGKHLKCTHVNDNRRDGDRHLPPFFGTVDWKSVMQALDEIGYEGDFSFELARQSFPAETHETWCRFTLELARDLQKLV